MEQNKELDMNEVIVDLINHHDCNEELHQALNEYHDYDLANAIQELDEEKKLQVLALFTDEELADIIAYFDDEDAIDIFDQLSKKRVAGVINQMEPDDARDILDEMDKPDADSLIPLLDKDVREDMEDLAIYPENCVGSIMNSNFLSISMGKDVKDAMRIVVSEAPDVETVNFIFVVNERNEFMGMIDLKKLIVTKSPCLVESIMDTHVVAVDAKDDYQKALKDVQNYDIYALPVVDGKELKGILTMDDAFEVLTNEAEEDYAKLAGLTEDEEEDETLVESIKKRIPWLAILLVLDIGVSLVDSFFEGIISHWPVLILFQSSILGLAGNCGTQSLAVAVRKISNNELESKKQVKKHIGRESLLGLSLGSILGVASFVFVTLLLTIIPKLNMSGASLTPATPVEIGCAVGIAIFVSITVSNFVGSLMPLVFTKMHIDPAVASGPFITTINDIVALVIYFAVAYFVLAILI
jgi:magnesium transporter